MVVSIARLQRKCVIKRLEDARTCGSRCKTEPGYINRFRTWCDRLDEFKKTFEKAHEEVLASLDEDDKDFEEQFEVEDRVREEFDNLYSDILELKQEFITDPNLETSSHKPKVKLPKLELRVFDGTSYKEFVPFRDLFETLIHKNKELSNIEKFSYLLSSLKGEAYQVVNAYPLSEANYEVAYSALLKRYENVRKLAFGSWEAIHSCKPASDNPSSLRKLLDVVTENLAVLKNMNFPVNQWDFILFHTVLTKIEEKTRTEFELKVGQSYMPKVPTFESLYKFLLETCEAWERSASTSQPPVSFTQPRKSPAQANKKQTTLVANVGPSCQFCGQIHHVGRCPDFLSLSATQRYDAVKEKHWCINCLRASCSWKSCKSRTTCRECGKKHHTLLHFPSVSASPATNGSAIPIAEPVRAIEAPPQQNPSPQPETAAVVLANTVVLEKTVLLSTARVNVLDKWGNTQQIRVLLDSGSQANFMTEACTRRLGLSKIKSGVPIFGLSNNAVSDMGKVQCTIHPQSNPDGKLEMEAIVLPKITADMPSSKINGSTWEHLKAVTLADPTYHLPGQIDALIGAELWPSILRPGCIPATDNSPMALNTVFGWVLMGPVPCDTPKRVNAMFAMSDLSLSDAVKKLWEVENIPTDLLPLEEDEVCEKHFRTTHTRDESGRYIVELPLKKDVPEFVGMRDHALRRFYACENKLKQKPELNSAYGAFMQEYLDQNHMSKVPPEQENRNHVDTKTNPADCVSRGLLPNQILDHQIWWSGPEWLYLPSHMWPSSSHIPPETKLVCEEEQKHTLLVTTREHELTLLLSRFSSLKMIQRIIAFSLRFIQTARKLPHKCGAITLPEMKHALLLLVGAVQKEDFQIELDSLKKGNIPKSLKNLAPFIDAQGLIRVGGRLGNAPLSYDARHPILLPNKHRLTELVIEDIHKTSLHAGAQTVQFLLVQQFWVVSAKRAIKRYLHKCIRCYKARPINVQPSMAPLPLDRLSGVKAFNKAACDYAGPFNVIIGKRRRGARSEKVWLCLFVCFATKALHLEVVTGLTADAFIAALRRFIARRGRCTHIFSDQGTNFVSAARQLAPLMASAAEREYIGFSTHPPSAPHFSGLAEAGVKSVKTHLTRVIGNQILTYEEFVTLVTQIESVLNSRPLCPVSTDPKDLSVLTPGHFLTLEPMTSLPEGNDLDAPLNHRWHHLQRLHCDFWRRWRHDYLNTLIQRSKWTHTRGSTLMIGDLVIIKEDDTKPLQWRLGRIVDVHPGRDGIVRVATVRTELGILKRPAVKLCPLPV